MIKAALLGAGFVANTHACAYDKIENATLVAVADVREDAGKKLAQEHGCSYYKSAREMLEKEDIDLVDVCLPTFLHEEYVLLAAQHKKHVLCEKPFTLTLESADRMIAACESAGVTLMVAQVLRFWPEYMEIKKRYDRGELGEIRMTYANRLGQHPNWGEWFKDPNKSGGGLFDLHLHDVDYLRYLFGPVKRVYATGWQSENGCWNHVVSSLEFCSGAKAVAEGSFQMTKDYPFTMTLRACGTKETLDFNLSAGFNLEDPDSAKNSLMRYSEGGQPEKIEVSPADPYRNEIQYFVDCLESGKKPEVLLPGESREVLSIILAIRESLESGKTITLTAS